MLKWTNLNILLFIIVFLLGSLLGFSLYGYLSSYGFQINKEIDLMNLLSLSVNSIIAIFVVRAIRKKDDGDRRKKEIIIKYFENFDSEFFNISREMAKNGVELKWVTGVLKRYRNRAYKLIKLADKHHFITENCIEASVLLENIKKIQDLLTDTPREGEIENGVRATNGKLSFSAKQIDDISSTTFDVTSNVFEIIVIINNR